MLNGSILIADDNHDVADTLVALLQSAGYDARATYDGYQAIAACHVDHPTIALLDVQMPGIDGCEVARRLREEPDAPLRIASISALGPDEEPMRSGARHFDDHFRKPIDADRLLDFLHRWTGVPEG